MSYRALLTDFGGVLTTDVFATFADYCHSAGLARDAFTRTLTEQPAAARLLTQVEVGEISDAEFERRFAPLLVQGSGVSIEADGLIARLTAALQPDEAMLVLLARVREAGYATAIVSNSFGMGAYDGYELDRRCDALVISADVGLRKPSRAIYELAAARLEIDAAQCVFVDDLPHNVSGAERAGMRGVLHRESSETVTELEALFTLAPVAG